MSRTSMQDKSLWRALLSPKVGIVFVVTFFCVSLSHSYAQFEDTTPADLTALSFTPTTINTGSGPVEVSVNISATDNLSGVFSVGVFFESPSGGQRLSTGGMAISPLRGTNVTGVGTITFPQFSETGTWEIAFVRLIDGANNFRDLVTADLVQMGFPTELTVLGQPDTTPADLTALSFTPTTINTGSGPVEVSVNISATDNLSGVFSVGVFFESPSGGQRLSTGGMAISPLRGTNVTGVGTITFPQFSETGTWEITFVRLIDGANNFRDLVTADLVQMGFPTELTVLGQPDTTPADLTALSFTPTTINTGSGPVEVSVNISATDNLSGVFSVGVFFESPSGGQRLSTGGMAISPLRGTNVTGVGTITFPQFSETGTWEIAFVRLIDGANNFRDLVTADLVQMGFPTKLEVVGEEEDITPPAITISATPATLWPPNGRMVPVTISGTITDADSGVDVGTVAYAVTDEYGLIQPSGHFTILDTTNGSYAFTIQLQASQRGNDRDGRQYTITISARDKEGNQGSNSTVVTVPHDQGQ